MSALYGQLSVSSGLLSGSLKSLEEPSGVTLVLPSDMLYLLMSSSTARR